MKPKQNELWRWGAPLLLGLLIWFSPCPNGLKPQAWHMFAIFAGTITYDHCVGSFLFYGNPLVRTNFSRVFLRRRVDDLVSLHPFHRIC